jgi:DNA-directed RNA polymerase specialized sigma24 family protein
LVTVLAWVKTVTKRYLTDEYRKARELATEDETLTHLEGQRGAIIHGRSSTEGQVRAALELRWLLRTLNRDYPQGARLVEAMRHDPDSTPTELAESMGTSVANVYQIRTRVRNLVSDLEGRARRKEQVR